MSLNDCSQKKIIEDGEKTKKTTITLAVEGKMPTFNPNEPWVIRYKEQFGEEPSFF